VEIVSFAGLSVKRSFFRNGRNDIMNQPTRLWGGRFRKQPDPRLMKLSSAAGEHARLVPQDVAGGKAHAAELGRAGLLTAQELQTILTALDGIAQDTIEGRIADVLERKRQLFEELIAQNGPPSRLGLSEDEIFGLFDIRARPRRAA
jgi:argininosuccinate lyase